MSKIEDVINLDKPEGINTSFKNSKFSKFLKSDLKDFVKENFLQCHFSVILNKAEYISFINNSDKKLLCAICASIEMTRKYLSNQII
ncbi:hypothetical protein [Polaribacter sp. M15]